MGLGRTLRNEITSWGILIMVIVVLSVILLKFRTNDSVVCQTGFLNASPPSGAICCTNATAGTAQACALNSSVRSLYADLNTFVQAFSEPKNWVVIVIVGIIGFGLVRLFTKEKE